MVQVNALIQKELEKGILDVDTHTPSDLTAFKVLTDALEDRPRSTPSV